MSLKKLVFFILFLFLANDCESGNHFAYAGTLLLNARLAVSDYRTQAEELAKWCDETGLHEEAKQTRDLILPEPVDRLYIPIFPMKVEEPELAADASEDQKKWLEGWQTLRQNYSKKLQEHARLASQQKRNILAMQLILTALHVDPNNEKLRNVLGYHLHEGEWRTAWEIKKLESGYVDHVRFGWILAEHVERYESGERYDSRRKKWTSAEEDRESHQRINSGWIIRTEHYDVQTNHSIEQGVVISRRLEDFYRVWKQVFVQYAVTPRQLAAIFDGQSITLKEPRHRIFFFKSRSDYIQTLKKNDPNIAMSVGFYQNKSKTCYFYMYDESVDNIAEAEAEVYRNIYHEGTHQLFAAARPNLSNLQNAPNFWATEAVAIYMETLRRENNYYVLGDPQDVRVKAAKYRFFESEFYVPFGQIVQLNMQGFQTFPEISQLYSQCGGMVYFLMHYDDGRYRDKFVTYLDMVYSGHHTPITLFELTGQHPKELDAQYETMLNQLKKP